MSALSIRITQNLPVVAKKLLKKSYLLSILLLIIFFIWLINTFLPILIVELKFQSKKILTEQLKIDSLTQLFIPNFLCGAIIDSSFATRGFKLCFRVAQTGIPWFSNHLSSKESRSIRSILLNT